MAECGRIFGQKERTMAKKAAAPRVTITEQHAVRFFRAGSTDQNSYSPDRLRVPIVHRWINLPPPYGQNKLIDITGQLFDGRHFACEVKHHDVASNPRWSYPAALSDRQAEYLQAVSDYGGLAWVWIGFAQDKTPLDNFVIPWHIYVDLQSSILREFKDAEPTPWKSWDMSVLRQHAGRTRVEGLRLKWGTKKAWCFFTQYEMQIWNRYGKGHGRPDYPQAFPITGEYL
jgi:hypothetical protein